ncbi:MAG: 3-deoxy-manno-octulosonate cytidylyltransferase [candidate division Zixibacteria bacterium]|nr:3-deoxy-manno-octulosonate cytidylyltransferase [candidate division Zixibacteria bacterium]
MPKVIGIIPSRYNSKRFPGKPLATLAGLPIIVRVIKQAQKATILDDVIVATDDERIAEVVRKHEGKAVITSGKFSCGTDRIASVAKNLKADIVMNIQGDEPMLSPEVITKTANYLIDNPKAVMSTACSKITDFSEIDNPNDVKVVIAKDNRALYFSRSRLPWFENKNGQTGSDLPEIYRHIGIYSFTAEFLQTFASLKQTPLELTEGLEQLRALENGYDIYCLKASQVFSGIDSREDLSRAEKILQNLR